MNKNIIFIAVLVISAGLVGGIFGGAINQNYFSKNIYEYPSFIENNFPDTGMNKDNLVIEGAEKLIVEQNEQISKNIDNVKRSLVKIFPYKKLSDGNKNEEATTTDLITAIDENKFYHQSQKTGEGVVLTSDGWIITNDLNAEIPEQIKEKYRIITAENEIFEIDKIVEDDNFLFLRLKEAKDLPAIELAEEKEVGTGNLVFAANGESRVLATNVVEKEREREVVKFSDQVNINLKLKDDPNEFFDQNTFLFNLNEQMAGIQVAPDKIISTEQLKPRIESLLKFGEIKKSGLGVYYVDLANIKMDEKYPTKGALIYPNKEGTALTPKSPAEKAGLKKGDIILSVNNTEIDKNNDLARVIQKYLPDEKLNIRYIRGGEENRKEIILE